MHNNTITTETNFQYVFIYFFEVSIFQIEIYFKIKYIFFLFLTNSNQNVTFFSFSILSRDLLKEKLRESKYILYFNFNEAVRILKNVLTEIKLKSKLKKIFMRKALQGCKYIYKSFHYHFNSMFYYTENPNVFHSLEILKIHKYRNVH